VDHSPTKDGRVPAETALAESVPAARPSEFPPLRLGELSITPPVLLAPMAGVTNLAFRRLARRFGAPLCTSEMIAARPLAERNPKTLKLAEFAHDEFPRSLQLYAVEPEWLARAVQLLVEENRVDHIDLNFGCPVRKVTERGGGAALPHRPRLLARLLEAAVRAAKTTPVSVKFRLGVDDDHLVYLQTGRIAEESGCAMMTLHARTASQHYEGEARWAAIGELRQHVSIPVLGNGDVWEAADALRMMRATGCHGVGIGRGCLGRPWLFADLSRMFRGQRPLPGPTLGEVVDIMIEHLEALLALLGQERGLMAFRRHATWYTKGFAGSAELRERLTRAPTVPDFLSCLAEVDRTQPFPTAALRAARGKRSQQHKVFLPPGYLETDESELPPPDDCIADGG